MKKVQKKGRALLMVVLIVAFICCVIAMDDHLVMAAEETIGWQAPWPHIPPKAGINKRYENAKVIKRYDKTNAHEIKGLVPDYMIEWLTDPEKWGPFYVNEIEHIKYEPSPGYAAATEKNAGKCKLRKDGLLLNWEAGLPFKDPKDGWEVAWNYEKRYESDDLINPYVVPVTDRTGRVQHWIRGELRWLHMAGRVDLDPKPVIPNSLNLERYNSFGYWEPYELRGVIPLYWRYLDQNKPDDQWMYIPSMRRIRRMSTAQRYDSIGLGWDICWDDFNNFAGKVMDYNWKLIEEKEALVPTMAKAQAQWVKGRHLSANDNYRRVKVYIIEVTPKDPNHIYSKIVMWVDSETWSIPYGYRYDQKGKLWRIFHSHIAHDAKGHCFPASMIILDIQRMHSSSCYMTGSVGNVGLKPEDFSWESMKKIYPSGR